MLGVEFKLIGFPGLLTQICCLLRFFGPREVPATHVVGLDIPQS